MRNLKVFSILLVLTACQSKDQIKYDQYLANGRDIYETKCANCHQSNGKGLGKLYPNIEQYTFSKNKKELSCLILKGKGAMPAQPQLQALDLAMLTTYLEQNFHQNEVLLDPKDFNAICR